MLKVILHKVFASFLALLVLVSTMSFTIEKHYCGDTLVDIAFFSEAKDCGMEIPPSTKKSCCNDEVEVIEGQDELKLSSVEDFDFSQFDFVVPFTPSYFNLYRSQSQKIIPNKDYSPPNLVFNIQLLDQVFLI